MHVDHSRNILSVEHLSFSYDSHIVLDDVSLSVHLGDYLGVIGPNGGGKSTLIKCMLGLLAPQSGSITLFGQPITQFRDWSKIGYVAQQATNFEQQFPATVFEIVSMGCFGKRGLFRSLTKEDKRHVEKALSYVGMSSFKDRLISDLSGGQKQRVFIARALASEPEIIFLDEPTVGVDVSSQHQFYSLLKTLNHELDLTLVLITHDIEMILKEVTEVACIDRKLIYHGDPKDFTKDANVRTHYGRNFEGHDLLHGH